MATLTEGLLENYIPVVQYHGLNTNKNITVGGSANVDMSGSTGTFKTPTGAATFGGASTFNSTIAVGADDTGYDVTFYGATAGQKLLWDESLDTLDGSAAKFKWKRNVLASSGNTTMTSAMSGSIMLLDGAATDYTLPAIGAGDIGMEFWFVVTVTATDQTITAAAADLLTGGVMCMSTAAGVENDAFSPDVTDDLIITMNGTTQGGIIGSTWHLIAISATRWYCDGTTIGSGTIVTPFS